MKITTFAPNYMNINFYNTSKNMDPLTTITPRTRTTYGDMPFPITLVNVPTVTTTTKTMTPLRINAIEYLNDKWASVEEGKKIYPMIKKALDKGQKVQLSVKGLDVDGRFFDKAICTLYGDFSEEFVDSHVDVVDIAHVDTIGLEDMKEMRKLYYYERPLYDKIIKGIDPILGFNDGFIIDNGVVYRPSMTDDDDEEGEEDEYYG